MRFVFKPSLLVLGLILLGQAFGANIVPVYVDGANEGYNSNDAPDSTSAGDGAVGDTLGEQRRWAFEKAAQYWAIRLASPVQIRIEAKMESLECETNSAILGQAGPFSAVFFNSSGSPHPRADTFYPYAIGDRIAGSDFDSSNVDIVSTFNEAIDTGCFSGGTWYYAMGAPPSDQISFFETVVHEIAHGLGVTTFVNLDTGKRDEDTDGTEHDDIYMVNLEDHSLSKTWPNMTDAERAASVEDTNDLHWVGTEVLASIGDVDSGTTSGHPQMYAPAPLEPGSSVAHWDTDVDDSSNRDDIMAPFASPDQKLLLTDDLLHDVGWNSFEASNCGFAEDQITHGNRTISSSEVLEACAWVRLGNDLVVDSTGGLDVLVGHQIFIRSGFNIKEGATFSAQVDPSIGL